MARQNSAAARARRLLALLPMMRRGQEIALDDLAAAVGASAEELAADLQTLSYCGLPPYTPDVLVDLEVDGGVVKVWGEPPALSRPVRLSAEEAVALAEALSACGRGPDDPLTVRLLEAAAQPATAEDVESLVRDSLAPVSTSVYQALATAMRTGRVVSIEYARFGDERPSAREIEPYSLENQGGNWYVHAVCRSAGGPRTFRLDRIRSAELTGETFDAAGARDRAFTGDEEPPRALLRFRSAEPDEREWPGVRVESRDDEGVVASLPHFGDRWLARKVLASFGDVSVMQPTSLKERVVRLGNTLGEG